MKLTSRAKESSSIQFCKSRQCNQAATSEGFCRLHYLASWKERKKTEQIDTEARLNQYIDKLAERYPDHYLEILRKDLAEKKEDVSSLMKSLESGDNPAEINHHFDEELVEMIKKIKKE